MPGEINETNWALALAEQMQGGEHASDPLFNPLVFRHQWMAAQNFAASKLVPEHFRGDPATCYVAITMALARGEDPIMYMQNVFMVGGTPGFKAEYLIARCRQRGIDLRWKVENLTPAVVTVPRHSTPKVTIDAAEQPNVAITCYVHGDDDPDRRVTLTSGDAIRAGWYRNGSGQYHHSLPRMLRWRTATWWVSLFAAHLKHGFHVVEELEDRQIELVSVEDPTPVRGAAAVRAALGSPPAEAVPATVLPSHGDPAPAARTEPAPQEETTEQTERAAWIARFMAATKELPESRVKRARADHGLQKIRKEQADVVKLRDLVADLERQVGEWKKLAAETADGAWTGPTDVGGLAEAISLCVDDLVQAGREGEVQLARDAADAPNAPVADMTTGQARRLLHVLLSKLPSGEDEDDDLPAVEEAVVEMAGRTGGTP